MKTAEESTVEDVVDEERKLQKMLVDCVEEALAVRLSCLACTSPCPEFTQDNCPYKVKWKRVLQKARKMMKGENRE